MQTDFHIGDRFWVHKNQHQKNLKQRFFVCNYICKFLISIRSYVQSVHYKILYKSYTNLIQIKKTNRQTKKALT